MRAPPDTSLTALFTELNQLTQAIHPKNDIDTSNKALPSLTYEHLQWFFEETLSNHPIDIILPEALDANSPLNSCPKDGIQASITYLKKIIALQKSNALQKPLVILLPIQSDKTLPHAESPWACLVVLPKNYHPLFGEPLNNTNAIMHYMDARLASASNETPTAFSLFHKILTQGCSIPSQQIVIPPAFSDAIFYDSSHFQQNDITDNLGFTAYNAIMLVLTGRNAFSQLMQPSDFLSNHLRKIFSPYLITAASIQNKLALLENEAQNVIHENLYMTLLYATIIDERNKNPINENDTMEALKEKLQNDLSYRKKQYLKTEKHLSPHLDQLNVDALHKLLTLSKHPFEMLEQLKKMREARYKQIILWEATLQKLIISQQKSEFPCLLSNIKSLGKFSYQYSAIGMFSEISLLTLLILKRISFLNTTALFLKELFIYNVGVIVFLFTRSTEKAKKADLFLHNQLQEKNTTILFKGIGIIVGIYLTYLSGIKSLLHLLLMNSIALKATTYLSEGIIDDINARVIQHKLPFDINHISCFRITAVLFALIEAMNSQSIDPCVRALTSMIASISLVNLAKKMFYGLREKPNHQPTPEQIFFILLLSNAGHMIGEFTSNTTMSILHTIQTKEHARSEAIEAIQTYQMERGLTEVTARTPSLLTTPSLWFNNENPVDITWRNAKNGYIHHTQCEVIPPRHPAPHEIFCEKTEGMPAL